MRHTVDEFLKKGAVDDQPTNRPGNPYLSGQLPHRDPEAMLAGNEDTDFPEPGENPEHSGEPEEEVNPEGAQQDMDPGQRQKRNQGDKKDDPLAA